MSTLYPLKFTPILKERIWGGEKLKTILSKKYSKGTIGESWEISAVDDNISIVENGFLKGNDLLDVIDLYMDELLGEKVFNRYGSNFPLLIKFIDAADDLSIQVHPNDELAEKRHESFGKTEMWYVMSADANAKLISGFNQKISKEEYLKHIENNTIVSVLNQQTVSKGDCIFIPAGRIHSIGSGLLIAEIQQSSDITYRIYDFGRKDASGKLRELHNDLAIDAIDFKLNSVSNTHATSAKNQTSKLQECDYFTTNKLVFDKPVDKDYISIDSFVIYICCEGKFDIKYNNNERISVSKGETVLLPAILKNVVLEPLVETEILEVYL